MKGADAPVAQDPKTPPPLGADAPAQPLVAETPAGEFAPIDLASFLTSGEPATTAGSTATAASAAGIDASSLVPVVVASPAAVPNAHASSPATPGALDPRQMPSIGALLPGGAAETAAVRREMRGLVPQFEDRLQRVIDRMEQEFGYTIEIVETVRTQERQDALFAQGRTQPGPVVTWTRNSNHTAGLAADVTVNGGWTDKAGFEQLARVAREEGLRTLWPRDPGHIELVTPTLGEERVAHAAPTVVRSRVETIASITARLMPAPVEVAPGSIPAADEVKILPWLPPQEGEVRILPFTPERVAVGSPELGEHSAPTRREQSTEGRHVPPGLARVATMARVADVAHVADVARVATVGTPGRAAANIVVDPPTAGGLPRPTLARERRERNADLAAVLPTTGSPTSQGAPVAGVVDASAGATGWGAKQRREGREAPEGQRAAVDAIREADTALMRAAIGGEGTGDRRTGEGIVPVAGMERTDAAERIARVLRVQESMAERPMSSVLLRLDHPDGGEDRIRVDLRGTTVGATLDIRDAAAADNLRAHAMELQAQLGRHGLEGEAITVRTMTRNDSAFTAAGAVAAEREGIRAGNAGNTGNSGTNQGSRDPRAAREEANTRGQDQPSSRQKRDQRGQR